MLGRRCAYLGNFSVPYSTESHVAASLESLGVDVLRIQEGETPTTEVARLASEHKADMFLWTQTYGLALTAGSKDDRLNMLKHLRRVGIPSVGFHLDRWWGLERNTQIFTEPFFSCDYLFTADGGHDEEWEEAGVNHHWLPPGVFHEEAYDGVKERHFAADIVFVGSWRHYGHEEWWPHRSKMLNTVRRKYRHRMKLFPQRQAIRGKELTNLYASCKLAIGDSCAVGNPSRYWSDRIPETTGRGALLIHPNVEGLDEVHPFLPVYTPGDLDEMMDLIEFYLVDDNAREDSRFANASHTREFNTYRNRMEELFKKVGLS